MSVETDFRAALAAHAALTTLVGTRISENAVPPGVALPYVVFTTTHTRDGVLYGADTMDSAQITVECWDKTAAGALAVAVQVEAAITAHETATPSLAAWKSSQLGGYDGELDLDAYVLTFEWVAQ